MKGMFVNLVFCEESQCDEVLVPFFRVGHDHWELIRHSPFSDLKEKLYMDFPL